MAANPQTLGGAFALPFTRSGWPDALDLALSTLPSLPRPLLSRLVARAIERLDEIDGDLDLEPEEDCGVAGDDDPAGGAAPVYYLNQALGPVGWQ